MKGTQPKKAFLAGGCFWCTEAIFQRLNGVTKTAPGICKGAETLQIEFDPSIISYKQLLEVFFKTHDPTTLNRQGHDIGEQYRSEIFFTNESEQQTAQEVLKEAQKSYKDSIVTKLSKFDNFTEAKDFHKDYYNLNPNAPYCQLIIDPKIKKLYKSFPKITKK